MWYINGRLVHAFEMMRKMFNHGWRVKNILTTFYTSNSPMLTSNSVEGGVSQADNCKKEGIYFNLP
jgi:hypothetical protein